MKLLIITQKVDVNDPVLGFFHGWIEEFARHCEKVSVICLQKGDYDLPENIKVLSLGKEESISKLKYLWRFYKFIWQERKNYDSVFAHMNQEYILLGGIFWKLFNKKVYMWRNHNAGSILTDIAVLFCKKIFCTSKFSFTAKYKKTEILPVGIDTTKFIKLESSKINKIRKSILFLGRIAPSKNVHIFIEALGFLKKQGVYFFASIYGEVFLKDALYLEKLKTRAQEFFLEHNLKFHTGVPNHQAPEIYNSHEIFVNLSSSGMYDKTIFEAMACGCLVLVSNDNLRGQINEDFIFKQGDILELSEKLEKLLNYSVEKQQNSSQYLQKFARKHSLKFLAEKLFFSMQHNIDGYIIA